MKFLGRVVGLAVLTALAPVPMAMLGTAYLLQRGWERDPDEPQAKDLHRAKDQK